MKHVLTSVTQTVQALPVAQERAKMSPERKQAQRNAILTSLVAFAVGAAIIEWTPWPWWTGAGVIAYGLVTFDQRAASDFLRFLGQLGRVVRTLKRDGDAQPPV